MEIVSTAVYVGPNVYAKAPLIRLTVDLHRRADMPVSECRRPRCCRRCSTLLPGLADRPRPRTAPPCRRAMQRDPDCRLGELMAQVALALQNQRRRAGRRSPSPAPAAHPDEVEVLYGYESEEVGLEAGEVARAILLELIAPREDDDRSTSPRPIEDFDDYAGRRALGPSALALVHAAEARDIPWVRLNDASLIQLGQGKYQKRIEAALTSQTSHIAVEIASDKELCARLLSDLGLPVPKQRARPRRRGRRRAPPSASAIPVVVKPVDGNHGRGVSVNLTTRRGGRGGLRDRRAARAAASSSRA